MADDTEKEKYRVLRRAEDWLRTRCSPRFHMLLIVSATGAFGFLFSFLMLKAGVSAMWLRYPLAVGLSYLVFLALLRLWLSYQMTHVSPAGANDDYNTVDAVLDIADFSTSGGGGGGSTGDDVAGHALGALDLDELIFVAIAVVSIFAGVVVCLYVVWTGPALLAEVLVDGMVMSGIYRKMKVVDPSYWISGVLRRTWLPVLLVAGFFAAAGFAMQKIDADAKSIGPVVAHVMGKVL